MKRTNIQPGRNVATQMAKIESNAAGKDGGAPKPQYRSRAATAMVVAIRTFIHSAVTARCKVRVSRCLTPVGGSCLFASVTSMEGSNVESIRAGCESGR